MCKPVIKWVGGKRQLLKELKERLPKKYNRYFEPFIGGGALFFDLKPINAFINDSNPELVNLYIVVKDNVEELIQNLNKHKNTDSYYYEIRNLDRDKTIYNQLSNIDKASRFIYLNKTGFNGLYRVNSKGQYNVPYGKYENPKYLDEENLRECSKYLKNAKIENSDFTIIENYIEKEDFVYFDPPYVPLNTTSSFTQYTKEGFDDDMQFRLKELCDYIDKSGAYFMLSNSYTEFVLDLYGENYKNHIVTANRAINCKANGRGKIKEVIITNY